MSLTGSRTVPQAPASLPPQRYLDLVEAEAALLAGTARALPATARSRSYPGFDVASLTAHVTSVLAHAASLARPGTPPEALPDALPGAGGEPGADALQAAAADFLAAARAADPTAPVPTYPTGALRPLAEVYRSVVTEVAVHRFDAQSAGDQQDPLAVDLSVDLIDAVFDRWAPLLLADRRAGLYLGGIVALDASDAGARWTVAVEEGRLAGRRAPAEAPADAVLSGPAHRVALALWKRIRRDADGLATSGDGGLVDRLLRIGYIPDPQTTATH